MIHTSGYFKIYRALFKKAIWTATTPEQKVIMITLLAMANFRESQWVWGEEKCDLMPGQFITSLPSIKKECGKGITVQNIRTALKLFENLEFLTCKSTNKGRLITITNWGLYQSDEAKLTGKSTDDQQATNRCLTAEEEGKESKKVKKEKNSVYSLQDIVKNYPGRKVKKVRDKKLPKLIEQYGEEQIRRCIDRYAEDCRLNSWRGILNESTFWNTRHVEFLDDFYKGPVADKPGQASPVDPDKARAERQAERYRAKLKKSRGETDE